jgi:cysteinyl-tRNA synthetase
MIQLYNTLTRKIEPLTPLNAPEVTVYTCGPTVYDYAHIGHWFTYIRWDLLISMLKNSDLKPNWVMNITDVGHLVSDADDGEDKLEKGAKREGKTAWEVAEFYAKDFLSEMELLGIQTPTHLTKATDHIAEQIELVQKLEAKGFTYVISDGVYYDTSKFPSYGDFAKLDLEEQQAGARVEYNTEKRNPTDFALWKFSPINQQRDMEWDSPWSPPGEPEGSRKGFPGWHIECSAMSMKYLGDTLDIHTGGIDHIPVHHTNEIAQSEAVTGARFANMWLHSNHVTVEGEKISKSLGNSIRLKDITEKGISLVAFRLHVLESHYRSQSKFTWESLEAASNRLNRWRQISDLRWQVIQPAQFLTEQPTSEAEFAVLEAEHPHTNTAHASISGFTSALENDLDTPRALTAIESLFSAIEQDGMTAFYLKDFVKLLQQIRHVLGVDLFSDDIGDTQKQQIAEREIARINKDWAASDRLRDELVGQKIGLRDTPSGAIWYWL